MKPHNPAISAKNEKQLHPCFVVKLGPSRMTAEKQCSPSVPYGALDLETELYRNRRICAIKQKTMACAECLHQYEIFLIIYQVKERAVRGNIHGQPH
ncbi:MAG: hypothetical protein WC784_05645 [Candidatus Shapirobacteria bacterium]|jgi:hypothetical protein